MGPSVAWARALGAVLLPAALWACPANQKTGQLCSHNGYCNRMTCDCWAGYEGPSCEFRICPSGAAWSDMASGIDTAHGSAVCSNRGFCDQTTGVCACLEGFEGTACERMSCPGTPTCNGHGRCISQARLGSEIYAKTYSGWDAAMVFGCHCDEGYSGYDCTQRVCPTGDDMLTVNQVNEVQYVRCSVENSVARRTGFYLGFRGAFTRLIAWDDGPAAVQGKLEEMSSVDSVAITFLNTSNEAGSGVGKACAYPQIIKVEFLKQYGDLPPLDVVVTSAHAAPIVELACQTSNTWFACPVTTFAVTAMYQYDQLGADGAAVAVNGSPTVPPTASVFAQKGTKEEHTCSNRGWCDQKTGICECYAPFESSDGSGVAAGTRGECGYRPATSQVYKCPGLVACMGHGVCSGSPTYTCSCSAGWTGAACGDRLCPEGKAWFGAPAGNNNAHEVSECSNRGICDRTTGQCKCQSVFEGTACELLKCPVSSTQQGQGLCSGHGDCLTMSQLAAYTQVNGDSTSFTYGATPSDEATWDFDAVQGCKCDAGFTGVDCNSRVCPSGDDINTPGVPEIQTLTCLTGFTGTGGAKCYKVYADRQMHLNTADSNNILTPDRYSWAQAKLVCDGMQDCAGVNKIIANPTAPTAIHTYTFTPMRYQDPTQWATVPGHTVYQRVNCEFQLEFRQQLTKKLPYFATVQDLKSALEALANIPEVTVEITSAGSASPNPSGTTTWSVGSGDIPPQTAASLHVCPTETQNPTVTRITFSKSPGNLPDLIWHGPDFGMHSSLAAASSCDRSAKSIAASGGLHCEDMCERTTIAELATGGAACAMIDVRLAQGTCTTDNGCTYVAATGGSPASCSDACAVVGTPTTANCIAAGYGCELSPGISGPTSVNCLLVDGCVFNSTPEPDECTDKCVAITTATTGAQTMDRWTQCVDDTEQIGGSADVGCTLTLPAPHSIVTTVQDGTYEDVECSNHGTCNFASGKCTCYHGYGASDGWSGKGTVPDCGYRLPHLKPDLQP